MAELGDASAAAHAEVAAAGRRAGRGPARDGRPPPSTGAGAPVADVAAALDLLRAELAPGDVVLVKASRAVGLDRLADALVQEREPVA